MFICALISISNLIIFYLYNNLYFKYNYKYKTFYLLISISSIIIKIIVQIWVLEKILILLIFIYYRNKSSICLFHSYNPISLYYTLFFITLFIYFIYFKKILNMWSDCWSTCSPNDPMIQDLTASAFNLVLITMLGFSSMSCHQSNINPLPNAFFILRVI